MENKKDIGKLIGKAVLIIVIIVAAFMIRTTLEKKEEKAVQEDTGGFGRELTYEESVSENNPILKVFKKDFSGAEVLVACEEDLTDDGCKDLVVIYRKDALTRMVIVMDDGDGINYTYTEPIPAPIENQKIQFKNIDKTGEIEFIVTGEKKGAVGYAIYRVIDGQPVDLFGEGMEDCC